MSKYEREWVSVGSLHEGDHFELPNKPDTICKVEHTSLSDLGDWPVRIIGYVILEGSLHWPVLYVHPDYQVVLLTPTTTYVHMGGKDWVDSLTEHHGVSGG